MGDNEMRGFVFAVSYIILFSAFLSGIPVDFQGSGINADNVAPIDPSLLVGFEDYQNFTKSDLSPLYGSEYYIVYDLGGFEWSTHFFDSVDWFTFERYRLFFGVWLGASWYATFYCANGTSRGTALTMSEISGDATDGVVKYSVILNNGDSAGSFVCVWNNTLYSNPNTAFDADALFVVHGLGFDETQSLNIGNLLLGLLFLQIPNVPPLVNGIIVIPLWASIIYVVWFLIISMIPFLGGG